MATAEPTLVKGLNDVEFVPALWPGKNTSGIKAFGKNVVVAVDEASEMSSGGVIVGTQARIEQLTAGSTSGCIVYAGPEAFRHFDDGTTWVGEKPRAGDRVFFEKFAGTLQQGVDGRQYRIMDYRCIAATLDMRNPDIREGMREIEVAQVALAGGIVHPSDLAPQPAPTALQQGGPAEQRPPNRRERRAAAAGVHA